MEERRRGEERRWNIGELRRSRGGEIGGAVTLRRCCDCDRKTGKSKSMVDGGVIGDDGGRWRDRR